MKSSLFKINLRDLLEGLVVTIIVTFLKAVYVYLDAKVFPTGDQLWEAAKLGLVIGAGWLVKNILTNSEGEFLAKEPE